MTKYPVLVCVFCALATGRADDLLKKQKEAPFATQKTAPTPFHLPAEAAEQISDLATLAKEAGERGDLVKAEALYNKLLDFDAPNEAKKTALWKMAAMYESNHVYSKAIAVYEKITDLFPQDPKTPEMLLKLGLLYRDAGASQIAITKLYSVLNAALKVNDNDQFGSYKALTQQAQFEIAETYFQAGDYEQADKFFSLVKRLELKHEDKARVEYRSVYCRFLLNDYTGAIAGARAFVKDYADTKYVPECRFLLASALKALNRTQEATDEVLSLLRAEKQLAASNPDNWIYWQKKTGNQIANELYQQGDFIKALSIYQTLAKLDNNPEWQLPVVYQIGLCFERLRFPPRAIEAYKFILDGCKKVAAKNPLPENLDTLNQMAKWRADQVSWIQDTDAQLQNLLGASEIPEASKKSVIP